MHPRGYKHFNHIKPSPARLKNFKAIKLILEFKNLVNHEFICSLIEILVFLY